MRKRIGEILIGRLLSEPKLVEGKLLKVCGYTVGHVVIKDGEETTIKQRCMSFGKQADVVSKHLHKGDLCCIEGTMSDEILVSERITFLSPKDKED